jgi:hypothetical protein
MEACQLMTRAESIAQEQLKILVSILEVAGSHLQRIADALPPSLQEQGETDFQGEPDVTSEVRRIILCVLTDSLGPAIADLRSASTYEPAPAPAETEDEETLPPPPHHPQ